MAIKGKYGELKDKKTSTEKRFTKRFRKTQEKLYPKTFGKCPRATLKFLECHRLSKVDFIIVCFGEFTDSQGRKIKYAGSN